VITPIVFSAVIPSIAANTQLAFPDERGLKNRTAKIIRINEIRFWLGGTGAANSVVASAFSTIEVQLRIGNNPVTGDLVRLATMVQPLDTSFGLSQAYSLMANGPLAIRFARPVLLAPGESISGQVRNRNLAFSANVRMTAFGEEAPAGTVGYMPWFTQYVTPLHTDGGGNFEDQSTEADLVNPFDTEMIVDRLIGRVIISNTNDDTFQGEGALRFDAVRLRIDDHLGTQIVRDRTPLGHICNLTREGWIVNAKLASKGFYRATVDARVATQVIGGANFQTFIGMTGYRKVG
jgi:hypothetical protein